MFWHFRENFTLGYEEIQSLKPSRTVFFSTTTTLTRTLCYEDISLTIVSSKGNYKGDGTKRHEFHKPISKLFWILALGRRCSMTMKMFSSRTMTLDNNGTWFLMMMVSGFHLISTFSSNLSIIFPVSLSLSHTHTQMHISIV